MMGKNDRTRAKLALLILSSLSLVLLFPLRVQSSYHWSHRTQVTSATNAAISGVLRWGTSGTEYLHLVTRECVSGPQCNGTSAIGVYCTIDSTLDWHEAWTHGDSLPAPRLGVNGVDYELFIDSTGQAHYLSEANNLQVYDPGNPFDVGIGYKRSDATNWDADQLPVLVNDSSAAGWDSLVSCASPHLTTSGSGSNLKLHLTYEQASTAPMVYTEKLLSEPDTSWSKEAELVSSFRGAFTTSMHKTRSTSLGRRA